MHGEDGLCMLHKECGEDVLPEICRVYPRSMKREGGVNQACCSSSCEAVIEILMDEKQLHLRLAHLPLRPEYAENSDKDMTGTCAECMWALQDRDLPLDARIGNICRMLGCDDAAMDEEAAFNLLIVTLQKLEEGSESMRRFGDHAAVRYSAGGIGLYRADSARFMEKFPRWQRWFENVLANHLLYMNFPFSDGRITPGQACRGLCLAYGLMRVLCADCDGQNDVVDALAGIFRLVEHSPFYYNARLFEGAAALLGL